MVVSPPSGHRRFLRLSIKRLACQQSLIHGVPWNVAFEHECQNSVSPRSTETSFGQSCRKIMGLMEVRTAVLGV